MSDAPNGSAAGDVLMIPCAMMLHLRRQFVHKLMIAAAFAAYCLAPGCNTTITPPAQPQQPVTVYLIDYGRHSGILLPREDSNRAVEYAYGDWRWFVLGSDSWVDIIPTLFWPTRGAIGRWEWITENDHDQIHAQLQCEAITPIVVEQSDATDLLNRLDALHRALDDERMYRPEVGLVFVRDDRKYHAFHNCNHVTAKWLRELGCEVDGTAIFNRFRLSSGEMK